MERAVIAGNFGDILPHLAWVLGYTLACTLAAILLFLRQMKKQ
jgi:predicted outer membrane lipoprotein